MVKLHLKRLSSPRTWPIKRKGITFITRPHPGPHPIELQLPITVLLRDLLGVVQTKKELKYILHKKDCLVDGKVCHDDKRPVGLLDVVSLPKVNQNYRVSINKKNKLVAISIPDKESKTKICKLVKKSSLPKKLFHLGTHDGRSFRVEDAKKYSVGDSIVISLPDQKIVDHLPLTKDATILLWKGSLVGKLGTVADIQGDHISINVGKESFKTQKEFAIVVGKTKPLITVGNNE